MCGIATVFFNNPEDQKWAQVCADSMLERIKHRGFPALTTSQVFGLSIMGCVRLPIRDPIAGGQPAFNRDFSVAAVLNGEIYNVDELASVRDGSESSDTAFLPNLYRQSRNGTADEGRVLRCRGMYALIIHDQATEPHTALVLRDHMGIKPLFLARSSKGIFLASELKAFRDVEHDSVREIRPGELLNIQYKDSHWIEARSIDVRGELMSDTCEVGHDRVSLSNVISSAVKRQWPVEGLPAAVLCSGGIDSSIVAYELLKHRSSLQPITAYTACCTDPKSASDSGDLIAARRLCSALHIPLREVRITYDDLFNVLADVIYHVESFEPNVVRNAAILYHVMRQIAADGIRVAFCGEGADELFWGYADFATSLDPDKLSALLLQDLHRTQLLRVDRIGMAHTIEVRVPLLDEMVVKYCSALSAQDRLLTSCGIWLGKSLLRESYVGKLPDEMILRRKATLAYGAGFGGVEMNDRPMNHRASFLLSAKGQSIASVMASFPEAFPAGTGTEERALYVHIYHALGFTVPAGYQSPTVATVEQN